MTSSTHVTELTGSAARWGPLWGARADDWAYNEEQKIPAYEDALDRIGPQAGQQVLDVACGAGVFLRLVADRGATPFGIDASEALIEVARARVPEADLRVGDMEALPYEDDSFDVVTGFSAFFFATEMVTALREARRVASPGAQVVIEVFGRHERNDLEAMKAIARPFFPPRPADAPEEPDYSQPGVLEAIATEAGLTPETAFYTSWAYEYPDEATMTRALMAPAGLGEIVGPAREEELKAALVEGLAPFRTPEGGYRLDNEYRTLIARA
jgi:SAM-dependent methyltransferase